MTRILSLITVVGLSAFVALPSQANDRRGYNWTGLYFGVHAGLGTGNVEQSSDLNGLKVEDDPPKKDKPSTGPLGGPVASGQTSVPDFTPDRTTVEGAFQTEADLSGGLVGGYLGYNYQFGNLVFGVDASLSASDLEGSSVTPVGVSTRVSGFLDGSSGQKAFVRSKEETIDAAATYNIDNLAIIAGRLGYAWGHTMVFAKAGVAFADVETSLTVGNRGVLESDERHIGFALGGGFEHAITNNLVVKFEYVHVNLGEEQHDTESNVDGLNLSAASEIDVKIDTFTMGLSYKF
ncbi:MAG: outer membrane beta-barrel protein [Pseudomonadota bacterium]